jgi:hypothetical protein
MGRAAVAVAVAVDAIPAEDGWVKSVDGRADGVEKVRVL